jgi:hypothetical protein
VVRPDQAVATFALGREPARATLEGLVRDVPARLAFQADSRESLRIRLSDPAGGLLEATAVLLRACGPSDSLIPSQSVN